MLRPMGGDGLTPAEGWAAAQASPGGRTERVVAWTNPQQQHPVHSLPPGFGVAFRGLSDDARARIEQLVADHLARQAGD